MTELYHRHLCGLLTMVRIPRGEIWSCVLAVHVHRVTLRPTQSHECRAAQPRFGTSSDTAFRTDDCFRGIRDDHSVGYGSRGRKDPRQIGGGGIGVNHNRAGSRPGVS
jgi:hypothetical protein